MSLGGRPSANDNTQSANMELNAPLLVIENWRAEAILRTDPALMGTLADVREVGSTLLQTMRSRRPTRHLRC